MLIGNLVEFATLISANAPVILERGTRPSSESLERFYSISRARCRRWERCMATLREELNQLSAGQRAAAWRRYLPHFVDLLGAELLVRVWGAVLTATDRASRQRHAAPVARQVLQAHLKARCGLLRLLVHELSVEAPLAAQLDRFRRLLERWTDLLTGHLVKRFALAEFAFQADRATEHGADQIADLQGRQPATVWDMYLLCARARFPHQALPDGIDGQLRDGQMRSILAALPAALFDEHGAPHSARLLHQLCRASLGDCQTAGKQAVARPRLR